MTRKHIHRKHDKRYKCVDCNRVFGLPSDLNRRRNSMREAAAGLPEFICNTEGCSSVRKKWIRKDHFIEHVRRCEVCRKKLVEATRAVAPEE